MQELRPSFWPQSATEAQLRRGLELSDKQNKELKALVVSLSEMILRNVTNKQ